MGDLKKENMKSSSGLFDMSKYINIINKRAVLKSQYSNFHLTQPREKKCPGMNYQNNIIYSLILICFFSFEGKTQVVLNGDFENNLCTDCVLEPYPQVFDSLMPHTHFHMSYVRGIDILTDTCINQSWHTPPPPYSGNWSVSVGALGTLTEHLFLELSKPLNVGQVYELNYWLYFWYDHNFSYHDSMRIGITTDTTVLGTQIMKSRTAKNTWVNESVQFTATFPATYISFSLEPLVGLSLTSIDSVTLTSIPTSFGILSNDQTVKLYPNPASNQLVIDIEEVIEEVVMKIYDFQGRMVERKYVEYLDKETLDVSRLIPGVYSLQLSSEGMFYSSKFIKL